MQLNHKEDIQRLIVVGKRPDGVSLDLTEQAGYSFGTDGIATRSGDTLTPAADGETTLTVTYGETAIEVPVTVRNAGTTPRVSYLHDVQPVLMKAGCNTGACHGAARGKNGFELSLFGYDAKKDHIRLTREAMGRRLNTGVPEESLVLLKPLGLVDHEGGSVIDEDSMEYEILERWIAEGAQPDPADPPKLTGIELLPPAAVLSNKDVTQRFVVQATYSDGTSRDVTDLAILSSSDDKTVAMGHGGVASAMDPGEAYIMARFGSFAVVSQVITLSEEMQLHWPEDATPANYIDEAIFEKLRALRVPPAEKCSDSEFIRRVYLDIVGTLPSTEETRTFLADEDPEKRAKLIDRLLERPEFAELWAMKWADLLRVQTVVNLVDRKALHRYNDWLRHAITNNKPIDQLTRELLTAEGGSFASPATNFFIAESDTLLMAENVAQVFLGIQLKCAQCHNHPFERWTMEDYYSFAAFFTQIGQKKSNDPRESIIYDKSSGEINNPKSGQPEPPKFLGGPEPDLKGTSRREAVAEWITSPENPWFAKTIVNRVWAHFLGAGITEPPDDVRVTNPPSHPELLTELEGRLREQSYDLKTLVRDICNTHTYQMSVYPRDAEMANARNFSHASVRRLDAEQLLDAISQVTQTKVKFPNLPLGSRAIEVADGPSGNEFLSLFGRPNRNSVCACERRTEPTLSQVLHLINGGTVQQALAAGDGTVSQLAGTEAEPGALVEEMYLAAYCRLPEEVEKQNLAEYIASSEDKRAALEDVMWTILNSKEFITQH